VAAFVAHPGRRDRLATPGATVGERACDGGPEALLAALFRLKAADFPDQGGHFPEQQRPKLLGSAVLGWKFRPNAARDRIGHGEQTRTSVLRPQSRIIGRNSFLRSSRVREQVSAGGRKPPKCRIHLARIDADRSCWPNDTNGLGRHTDAWGQPVRRCRRRCRPAPPVLVGHRGRNRRRPPRHLAVQADDRAGTVARPGHLAVRRRTGWLAQSAV